MGLNLVIFSQCKNNLQTSFSVRDVNIQISILELIVVKHVIEGIAELIRNLLDLELFTVNLILNIINPEVQFGDVHLSVFKASLSNLETFHECVNFVNKFFFPFLCFLGRDFQLLHVITNGFQLLFNILELTFSQFSSLSRSFEFILLNTQFSGQFIEFLLKDVEQELEAIAS